MKSSPHLPETRDQLDRLDQLVWKITFVAVLGSLMGQVDATVVNVTFAGSESPVTSAAIGVGFCALFIYFLALAGGTMPFIRRYSTI